MELNAILDDVYWWSTRYHSNISETALAEKIFSILQYHGNYIKDDKITSILFVHNSEIRYRTKYTESGNYITDYYNLNKHKGDIAFYDGDPAELKEIVKKFIKAVMQGNYQISSSVTEPVNNLEDAKKIADKYTKKGTKMKDVFDKMIEVNKASAVNTAKVELGKSANKLVLDKIKPQLPMFVKGYADSPLAELVVGNVVAGLLIQFAPGNEKARVLSEAMIAAGVQVAVEQFDIPGLVKELLANVDISGIEDTD